MNSTLQYCFVVLLPPSWHQLKKFGLPRHFICEIAGHSRESSLDDYYEIDKNQRKQLSYTISGFSKPSSQNSASKSSKVSLNSANGAASNHAIAIKQRTPLSSISPYPATEPNESDNGFQSCISVCLISSIPTWFYIPVHGSFRQQFSASSSTKLLGLYVQLIWVTPKTPWSLRNYRKGEGLALLSQSMKTKL